MCVLCVLYVFVLCVCVVCVQLCVVCGCGVCMCLFVLCVGVCVCGVCVACMCLCRVRVLSVSVSCVCIVCVGSHTGIFELRQSQTACDPSETIDTPLRLFTATVESPFLSHTRQIRLTAYYTPRGTRPLRHRNFRIPACEI